MSLTASLLRPVAGISTSHELYQYLLQGSETDSGARVTVNSAMQVAAVFSAVRVLSESVAQVPLIVYRHTDTGKERATDHFLYPILHDAPNEFQTAFQWREMMQAHLVLSGNAYSIITKVRDQVRELMPIPPARVRVERDDLLGVRYEVRMPDGSGLPVPRDRMFHVPGLSFDGLVGLSPLHYQREVVGLAIQLQRHGARLFKHGALIGGMLQHPRKLSEGAYDRLVDSFNEKYAGVSNAHKTILLEEGTKFEKMGMTAGDAQFLEQRKYQRSEIAALFRVPPHMIGDLEHATYTNIGQQALEFVKFSLTPWFVRWEQQVTRQLIPVADQATYFAEFLVDGLLRGDQKSRYIAYRTAILTGWMNRNEARRLESMDAAEGLDEFLVPMNMDDAVDRADDGPPPEGARS